MSFVKLPLQRLRKSSLPPVWELCWIVSSLYPQSWLKLIYRSSASLAPAFAGITLSEKGSLVLGCYFHITDHRYPQTGAKSPAKKC